MPHLALAALLALSPAAPPPPRAQTAPCDTCVTGVENFGVVSPALWRGAQPTAEGFRELARRGARSVVSFREDHDDAPLLAGTGLRYLRIPSKAFRPEQGNLARFLAFMGDPANQPVFIHCAQGRDRTGYNAAVYRMAVEGWTADEAIDEMKAHRFNRIWIRNIPWLRKLDVEALKAEVLQTAAPAAAPH